MDVGRQLYNEAITSSNELEDASAVEPQYEIPFAVNTNEKPETPAGNPGYTELDVNKMQRSNSREDSTYQKLIRRNSDYVVRANESGESYEEIKMGKNLPGYQELDSNKREIEEYPTYEKLAKA